ncbi:hypothetical protein HY501_00935, partial [Candidatus Woesearchaeota archaeon]|nr:hypothetical protein [Candidatus Woesearchaeota archaeon]
MIRRAVSGLAAILALSGCPPEKKMPEMAPKYELVSLSSLKGNPALYEGKGVEAAGIPRASFYGDNGWDN